MTQARTVEEFEALIKDRREKRAMFLDGLREMRASLKKLQKASDAEPLTRETETFNRSVWQTLAEMSAEWEFWLTHRADYQMHVQDPNVISKMQ